MHLAKFFGSHQDSTYCAESRSLTLVILILVCIFHSMLQCRFDIIEMYIDRKLDIIDIIVFFICVFNLLKSISGLVLTELRPKDILGQGSLCDFCTLVLPQVVDIDLGRYGSFAHSISKIALFLRLPRRLTLQMFWLVRGDVLLL